SICALPSGWSPQSRASEHPRAIPRTPPPPPPRALLQSHQTAQSGHAPSAPRLLVRRSEERPGNPLSHASLVKPPRTATAYITES
ncbi:hypothetical protein C8R46DRAFT_952250, partial [Mycena filopes]